MASTDAEDLSRFNAGTLVIGGTYTYDASTSGLTDSQGPRVVFRNEASEVIVRGGAVVETAQIFVVAGNGIAVEDGAILDTTRSSHSVIDSRAGYLYGNSLRTGTVWSARFSPSPTAG
jgi:hypothetical protein